MKTVSFSLLTVAALVVSALSVAPAHGAAPIKTPAPENTWAFFEALPDAILPKEIGTRAKREDFHKEYEGRLRQLEEAKAKYSEDGDGEEVYFDEGYVTEVDYQLFWDPTALEPYQVTLNYVEANGSIPAISLSVYQGSDPDKIFGILRVLENHYEEASTLKAQQYYWYSVSKKTVTPATLPLDVPYTDEEITDDGLLYYRQNELYWAMRDRQFDWNIDRDHIVLTLEGIGAVPVRYDWNGKEFVRNRSYSPLSIYSGGVGNFSFGDEIHFDVHGYEATWINVDDEYTRAWGYVKEGEEDPRLIVYAYGVGTATIDAIDVFYPGYKLFNSIYAGMPAAEAIEAIQAWYDWEDTNARPPYVSAFDGKAWIFTGRDDPFMLGVDLKYYKNDKLTPDAVIEVIRVAPAVG